MLDTAIYSRLSTDAVLTAIIPATRINPIQGSLNDDEVDHLYYTIDLVKIDNYTDTPSPQEFYTVTVDIFAKEIDTLSTASERARQLLHGVTFGQVEYSYLNGYSTPREERTRHAQLTFNVSWLADTFAGLLIWTRGSDEIVRLRNVTNSLTGAFVNDATVTATLYEADETTVVDTFAMPYSGTPGMYQAEVSDATTAGMSDNTYRLKAVAVHDSTRVYWATIRMVN